jgi:VWFA-related protein
MSDAFGVLLKRMRPQDRIALASFASQFQMLMEWRNVAGKPVDVLAPAPQAGSDFFRALERAIGSFKKEKDRKAIIVMTDGRDTSMFDDVVRLGKIVAVDADKDFQKLLKSVAKQSIPTYFIAMNTDRNRDSTALDFEHGALEGASGRAFADNYLVAVRSRMERLAEATGGKVLYPKTIADVVPLYDAVGRDLGYSYSMGYSSNNKSNDGKPRRIEVRVRKNGLKVTQSRDSYTR